MSSRNHPEEVDKTNKAGIMKDIFVGLGGVGRIQPTKPTINRSEIPKGQNILVVNCSKLYFEDDEDEEESKDEE